MMTLSIEDIKRCREIALGANGLIMDIVRAVSEQTEIPIKAILSDAKTRPLAQARWLICYIAHVDHGHPLTAIARVLRYKDHTGVLYGVQQEAECRRLQSIECADKMNGPGSVTSAHPGPTIGDLSEEIANHG